jgi:endonuclease G
MMSQAEKARLLHSYNATLLGNDEVRDDLEGLEVALPPDRAMERESIILRRRRPVLAIQGGTATLEFADAEDGRLWRDRLDRAKDVLSPVIAAVGRIDLRHNPNYSWVGTGWLIDKNIIVTNRHVAEEFARLDGDGFVFQTGFDGAMEAAIDFLQEIDRGDRQMFEIRRVLHIEPQPGVDLAFLEVDQTGGPLARPIPLSKSAPSEVPAVATIGYPAYDSRIPEPALMQEIYGKIYDKKRLAPGAITGVDETNVHHNCTTLGGNSGSAVVDLSTGEALGLHFSGSFLRTNYAVRADIVEERLDALRRGRLRVRPENPRSGSSRPIVTRSAPPSPRIVAGSTGARSLVIDVPLVVSVSIGDLTSAGTRSRERSLDVDFGEDAGDSSDVETEARARPEDYADRRGYVAEFLGDDLEVPLPRVKKHASDVLKFGGGESVLKYEHFSVVYNERRRMCFFSACNVNGARSKSSKRSAWRFDPRIPEELQIMRECYGNSPKFSRGHMTRREDPAWGTERAIQLGSDDSMHVTNVTPQMQAFNSPIWLALEDYALQHAREDRMKISVFTGPYFTKNDPTMFGVRIPVAFWKVIAFVHDETGELCATGYEMSQADNLVESEFVFGQFRSPQLNLATQVPVATIEAKAGLSFGDLSAQDPFGQEGLESGARPLLAFEQIRFV